MGIVQPAFSTPAREKYCEWCGKELQSQSRGRKRRYCSRSCRQRAYEHRKRRNEAAGRVDGTVVSEGKLQQLADQLFEARCAAEDISTAIADGESSAELDALVSEVIQLIKQAEQFPG